MLGMMMNTNLPWAQSAWKHWVDHIIKQGHKYGFKRAALVYATGATAATSNSAFMLSQHEIKKFNDFFDGICENCDRITLQGKTYMVKSLNSDQLIAFNGAKYVVISRAKTMHIIVMCESRSRHEDGALWLLRLTDKLASKGY